MQQTEGAWCIQMYSLLFAAYTFRLGSLFSKCVLPQDNHSVQLARNAWQTATASHSRFSWDFLFFQMAFRIKMHAEYVLVVNGEYEHMNVLAKAIHMRHWPSFVSLCQYRLWLAHICVATSAEVRWRDDGGKSVCFHIGLCAIIISALIFLNVLGHLWI